MECPKCGQRAYVINSTEENLQRVRQYRCPNCKSYIYTRESIIACYQPSKEELDQFKRQGVRKHD